MSRTRIAVLCSALALMVPASGAHAQAVGAATQAILAKMMGEAMPLLLEATATLTEAQGNKQAADSLKAQIEEIRSGATTRDKAVVERAMTLTSSASTSLTTSLAGQARELTAEQRALFVKGAVQFFLAVKSSREVLQMLPSLTTALAGATSGGPLAIARNARDLPMAKHVVTGIPEMIKGNIQAAGALKDYIVANKIPVDASAMAAAFAP